MGKTVIGQAITAVLIFFLLLFTYGCMQVGNQAAPMERESLSAKNSAFSMGGVNISIPLPAGYVDAPASVRQAVAAQFMPPENIFGVYTPVVDTGKGEGAALLRNRRLLVISARPEFAHEIVDGSFYRAMQRDLTRVNGNFSPERIAQFKVLTDNYYARDDAFAHSLGVYERGRNSLSIARIARQAASRGAGATSVYPGFVPGADVKMVLQGWDQAYFSRAYHQVAVQNVLLVNGRCLNVYFFAPLASEADIYAALQENKEYMAALAASLAGQAAPRPAPDDVAQKRDSAS